MKRLSLLLWFIFSLVLGYSQTNIKFSADRNYIASIQPLDEIDSLSIDSNKVELPQNVRALVTCRYFDGLGREEQIRQVGITPDKKSLVSSTTYNNRGLKSATTLPVPYSKFDLILPKVIIHPVQLVDGGEYVTSDKLSDARQKYYPSGYDYQEYTYESTPEARTLTTTKPGETWHQHPQRTTYTLNNSSEVIRFRIVTSTEINNTGYYQAGSLSVVQETDEDGKITRSYVDAFGRTIMTRQGVDCDTYYLYDEYDRLCYVLPPKAVDELKNVGSYSDSSSAIQQYAYVYKYDTRGNCSRKKLPGCKAVTMAYDAANRLVLSQNGNQESGNLWTVTKYDALSRVAYTYEFDPLQSPASLIQYCSTRRFIEERADKTMEWPGLGYTLQILPPPTTVQFLTVNYYDDYTFLNNDNNHATALAYHAKDGYGEAYTSAKGLLTGKKSYSLETSSYVLTVYYYDEWGRVVQTRSNDPIGGYNNEYTLYDVAGNIIQSYAEYVPSSTLLSEPISELTQNTYDHSGRIISSKLTINGEHETSVEYEYDKFGRVSRKSRDGGVNYTTYSYNIQDWITLIEDFDFSQHIYYDSIPGNTGSPYFNGNISALKWQPNPLHYDTISSAFSNSIGYIFTYDALNRLTAADSKQGDQLNLPGNYSVQYSYDKQGNITELSRYRGTNVLCDELSFDYRGNQLIRVSDEAGSQDSYELKEYQDQYSGDNEEFTYDQNGNMISDLDRNIVRISYNTLNLPETIEFSNGNKISHEYLSDGTKLSTTYSTKLSSIVAPKGTISPSDIVLNSINKIYYSKNREYKKSFRSYDLTRIRNSEGYYNPNQGFRYYTRDYQGNVRTVYGIDSTETGLQTVTLQRMQYYPYGLPTDNCYNSDFQPYKYGEKEFIETHGYDVYDYETRMYYPAIGRFMTMDPMAESYYSISPYAYCANNPILYVDPSGKVFETAWDVASFIIGAVSLDENLRNGNYWDAALDGVGMLMDAAAILLPGVPGGASASIQALRGTETQLAKNGDKVQKVTSFLRDTKRGRDNEALVLKKFGLTKNTKKFPVKITTKSNEEKRIKVIPDAVTDEYIVEIKDRIEVYDTEQIKGMRKLAEDQGKKFMLIVGDKTYISTKITDNKDEILRIPEIGPQ